MVVQKDVEPREDAVANKFHHYISTLHCGSDTAAILALASIIEEGLRKLDKPVMIMPPCVAPVHIQEMDPNPFEKNPFEKEKGI